MNNDNLKAERILKLIRIQAHVILGNGRLREHNEDSIRHLREAERQLDLADRAHGTRCVSPGNEYV